MPSKFVECYAKYKDFCYEIFDRIILKVYIPLIQMETGMVYYLRNVRRMNCISKEVLKGLTKRFIQRVEKYADEEQIPLITAKRGVNKLAWMNGMTCTAFPCIVFSIFFYKRHKVHYL